MILTGIGRSSLYKLIETGSIKTSTVSQPGAKRGCRLIHVESLLSFIENQSNG